MQIKQNETANFSFCDRFSLAYTLGSGVMGSLFISIQTLFKDKNEVTQFFVKKMHDTLYKNQNAIVANRSFCNWERDKGDFISKVNTKLNEVLGTQQRDYYPGSQGGNDPAQLAFEVLYHEVGDGYLEYSDGQFQLSDEDDAARIMSSLKMSYAHL